MTSMASPCAGFPWSSLDQRSGAIALSAFYRALAIGNMGVVAPISACSAIVPVAVGVATGDRPSALQTAGLVLALAGVALASREEVLAAAKVS